MVTPCWVAPGITVLPARMVVSISIEKKNTSGWNGGNVRKHALYA